MSLEAKVKAVETKKEEDIKAELYTPRKCSATNRVITAKDHASVQINIGHLDDKGVYNRTYTTVAFCGYVRKSGEADDALNRIAASKKLNLMKDIYSFRPYEKAKEASKESEL
eukprot:TRINITY_DN7668_c0_g1_i1.p1 TRINITY_DN7668_c0_g1~~TRINITY_DN7668_c0_g1_i1.p1  ORF type:complete len:113 (+),score=29.95 TRINITY_DN7668_c0_g1_i1:57-395(+)